MAIPYLEKDSSDPSLPMNRPIPRRAQMQKWCSAEKAIFDAVQVVEAMAADSRLTAAVNLLHAARSQVADFVDGITRDDSTSLSLAQTIERQLCDPTVPPRWDDFEDADWRLIAEKLRETSSHS
jgi:hypothetical protein